MKTERSSLSPDCEREALYRAQSASMDVRAIITGNLRITRHLLSTGGLKKALVEFKDVVNEVPDMSIRDLWTHVNQSCDTKELFAAHGIVAEIFHQIDETIRRIPLTLRVINNRLHITRSHGKRENWMPLVLHQDNKYATADQLWKPDEIELVLQALETDGPFGVEIFTLPQTSGKDEEAVCDLITFQAVESVHAVVESDAYVRSLQEAGIPAYSGRDPWFWTLVAVVAAVVAAVALIVTIVCLIVDFDWDTEKYEFKTKACDVAAWMTLICGFIFLAASFLRGDPNTQLCINGTCYRNRNELFNSDPVIN
jgi:hypothetical protein